MAAVVASGCARSAPRVAVYSGEGAMEPYITAAQTTAAEKGGLQADRLETPAIAAGALENYDVLIFPGGTGNGQAAGLGEDGARAVEQFARNGGGVIGICAGGYLCAEGYNEGTKRLELINARLWELDDWERGTGVVALQPEGAPEGETIDFQFENAPIFEPAGRDDMPPYQVIARFVSDPAGEPEGRKSIAGQDAIIAAPYHEGRVVLFGPHPELTPGRENDLVQAIQWVSGRKDELALQP